MECRVIKQKNNINFSPFIKLDEKLFIDSEKYPKDISLYYINVVTLETYFDSILECKLSCTPRGIGEKQLNICKALMRQYSNNGGEDDYYFSDLGRYFFGNGLKPSAMFYQDISSMFEAIILMYQIAYAHYILGKYNRMRNGNFPYWCCGISTRNLLASFWEVGIISAIKVQNECYDHSYIIVPFFLKNPESTGVIIIDPTSDQLIEDEEKKVRNLMIITTKERWSYITDWKCGADLYPQHVGISACDGVNKVEYHNYLKQALQNPVVCN